MICPDLALFADGAHEGEWKKLIDLAAAQGYTKFWVTDDGNHSSANPDDMAGLPVFFNDMIDYIKSMQGSDRMLPSAA